MSSMPQRYQQTVGLFSIFILLCGLLAGCSIEANTLDPDKASAGQATATRDQSSIDESATKLSNDLYQMDLAVADEWNIERSRSCSRFDSWIWAQTIDEEYGDASQLVADSSGRVCSSLPVGFAPMIYHIKIPIAAKKATLVDVVDGDTIKISVNGVEDTVRLYQINAPETSALGGGAMCGGADATRYLEYILGFSGGEIWLEEDETPRDTYDRRLAYVWFKGGPNEVYMANEVMVRSGFAAHKIYAPDRMHSAYLDRSAEFAQGYDLGVLPACGSFTAPISSPQSTATSVPQAPTEPPPSRGNCDSSYPDVCIPPIGQTGDLDCPDITYRRFRVQQPDPHGFDLDFDGIGCEWIDG